jgi:kinesin family protein 6/9
VLGENTTQQEAFKPAIKFLDEIIKKNLNGTIFFHGATGSGKTFSMSGGERKNNGIVQQSICYIEKQSGFV